MAEITIFISCTKANLDVARDVAAALRVRGIKRWLYESDIPYGSPDWLAAVKDAICDCAGVILIATPELLASHPAHEEATLAYAFNLPIYPAQADGDDLADCVWESFRNQCVDIRGDKFESGINKLIDQILQKAEKEEESNINVDNNIAQTIVSDDDDIWRLAGKKRPAATGLLDEDNKKQVCGFIKRKIVRQFELIRIAHPGRHEELKAFGLLFLFNMSLDEVAKKLKTTAESVEILKQNALDFLRQDKVFVSMVRDWLDIKC